MCVCVFCFLSLCQALAAKSRGNDLFSKGLFEESIVEFTNAIDNDPTDSIFYSNRSGAYSSLGKFEEALADANKCLELQPEFVKGYSRKGKALFGLKKYKEAKEAYEEGLKKDANNAALKEGIEETNKAMQPAGAINPAAMFGPGKDTRNIQLEKT